ncbi:MAG TPA: hypothetical protein VG847_09770 [Chitinophagaceae bacterium]|nr:hypothetical protein [Chitinophagaceae bacterium]
MKQKNLALPLTVFTAFILFIAGCSKGPKGDTGATGPQGPQGTTGATGPAGTANVIYSPWLNVAFQQSGVDTNVLGTIPAPELSDSILNSGFVKVYYNAGSDAPGGQFVLSLPIDEPFLFTDTAQNPITLIANPYFTLDTIYVLANYDLSSYQQSGYNYSQFRYIIIPGGVAGLPAKIGEANKPLDWNNYNAVKQYFGLKD